MHIVQVSRSTSVLSVLSVVKKNKIPKELNYYS